MPRVSCDHQRNKSNVTLNSKVASDTLDPETAFLINQKLNEKTLRHSANIEAIQGRHSTKLTTKSTKKISIQEQIESPSKNLI